MIEVEITVKLNNGVTIAVANEQLGMSGGSNSVIDSEKAASMLLAAYHKAKKAIESQK